MAVDKAAKTRAWATCGLFFGVALLNLAAFACIFLVCLAGSMGTSEENQFILPELSLATFRGIVRGDDGRYEVKFVWFLNVLGWTWPGHKTRIEYNINGITPGDMLTLPKHLMRAGAGAGLSPTMWACLDNRGFCDSPFFSAWVGEPQRVFSTATALNSCLVAMPLLLGAAVSRSVFVGALASAAAGLAAGSATLVGYQLLEYLDYIGVEGTEVRLGSGFLLLAWGALLLSLCANAAALWARWLRSPLKSWLDDKSREELELLVDEILASEDRADVKNLDEADISSHTELKTADVEGPPPPQADREKHEDLVVLGEE